MSNGTIEQIDPPGWQQVERPKEQWGELAVTFDYGDLEGVRLTLRAENGLDLLLKLPGIRDRLKSMGANKTSLEDYQKRHDAVYPTQAETPQEGVADAQGPAEPAKPRRANMSGESEVVVSFEYKGFPVTFKLFGSNGNGNLARLPRTIELLSSMAAFPPPKPFVGPEGEQMPQSGSRVPLSVLTTRERQVLIGIANGKQLKEIARDYGLSQQTVFTYSSTIRNKLGLKGKNRMRLVWYAAEHGLIQDIFSGEEGEDGLA